MYALMLGIAMVAAADAGDAKNDDGNTLRGIVVTGLDDDGTLTARLKAKLPAVNSMTAISYKILLLDDNGKMRPVDPEDDQFHVGQRFRIEIKTHIDQFIYVFHEDKDGSRTLLLPEPGKDVPKAKSEATSILPRANRWFEFTPPAGTEILHVFATAETIEGLVPKTRPRTEREKIQFKTKQDKLFEEADKSNSKVVTSPSVTAVASLDHQGTALRLRGFLWKPKGLDKEGWKTVAKGSYEAGALHPMRLSIALKTQ